MPFWPWYMAACVVLIVIGRDSNWFGPAAVLAGLLAMRIVMHEAAPAYQQVWACAVWLSVAGVLAYKGLWLASTLCATSGIVYPALMLIGLRIEYMGLVAVLADILMLSGLAASHIGGGGGLAHDSDIGRLADHSDTGLARSGVLLAPDQSGMASREASASAASRQD